jgi:hypothetical protein
LATFDGISSGGLRIGPFGDHMSWSILHSRRRRDG